VTRYVGLGSEVVFGTPAPATRYIESIADLKPDQGWIIPPPIASRAFRKRNLGPYTATGSIGDFGVDPLNIGELLLGAFGSVSTLQQGGTAARLHTFTPVEGVLPSLTVRLGVEATERISPGTFVEALTLKFAHDKDVQANAQILSGYVETKGAIGSPTLSTLQNLNMQDINSIYTIDGSPKRNVVYDFEFTIKNNIPIAKRDLSGRQFTTARVGQREVTGKLSAYFDTTAEYDRFIAGTEFTLIARAQGPLIASPYYYYLEVEMRKCAYDKDAAPGVKAQSEPLVVDAPFQALYDSTGGFNAEAKAKLMNTIAAY
jgi:hypothetical protein